MNRFISILIAFFITSFSTVSYAETAHGKAYLATFYTCSGCVSTIFLSNITHDDVDITITFYNADGSILKDSGNNRLWGYNIVNYDDNPLTSASVLGTIEAGNSSYIDLTNGSDHGYAVIEWSQSNSTVPYALIAHGKYHATNSRFAIPINDGKPF